MADRYAKAAGGNWTAAGTWSATGSGGGDSAGAPTAADRAIFETGSGNVTVDSGAVCRSADFTVGTGAYGGTLTHTAAVTWTFGDATAGTGNVALKFSAGMTYTLGNAFTSAISFISSSATQQTITTAGKTLGGVTYNGAGSSYLFSDTHTCNTVTHSAGALDTGNQTFTFTSLSSTSGNRTLTLGTSSGTCSTGNWNYSGTNSTLSAASSTITLSGASQIFTTDSGDTYGTLNFTGSGTLTTSLAFSCTTLTRTGTAAKTDGLSLGANVTVSGTCTLNSNSSINRLLVKSATLGTPVTISAAVLVATNIVDFRDITGGGAATWTTGASGATAFGDALGNSGITMTAGATQTATGTASFTWSTHGWTSRVPLPQDDVVINNAFIAGRTVTMDMPRAGKNIDFSGATGNPTIAWGAAATTLTNYGNVLMAAGSSPSGSTITWNMEGRGSHTITSNGVTWADASRIAINSFGGTYTLQDAFTAAASASPSILSCTSGTFNTNNFNVTTGQIAVSSGATMNLGTTTWTINSTSTGNICNVNTGATLSAASAVFVINSHTASRTWTGGGKTYGTLNYTVAGSTGALVIASSGTTFGTINFSDASNARTLTLTQGNIFNITNDFNVRGTPGKLMTINSASAGSAATLSKTSGFISCDYVSIQDSTATGGAAWYAGVNSTNVSNNTGWIFTGPVYGGRAIGSSTRPAVF